MATKVFMSVVIQRRHLKEFFGAVADIQASSPLSIHVVESVSTLFTTTFRFEVKGSHQQVDLFTEWVEQFVRLNSLPTRTRR